MQQRAQFWEKSLFATGGKLNFKKCYWYCMTWIWDEDGQPTMMNSTEAPVELQLTYGESNAKTTICRKEPNKALKTLGFCSSPSGQQKTQLKETTNTLHQITKNIYATPMSQLQGRLLIPVYLHSKLWYVFAATSFSKKDCKKLDRIYCQTVCLVFVIHLLLQTLSIS
mmetsp:Transcript_5434/g.8337  ORF Transcript_5434/g.8337 Transcript_5434/m.8337 type:complete len:168 (+) Transcript_5434:1203-1706(+)